MMKHANDLHTVHNTI